MGSIQKKLGYLFQKMDIGFCRVVESVLLRNEPDDNKIKMPFIAVCGIPRSGTTVTFQLTTQAIDGMVISNLDYLFYRTPLLGYWISKWFTRPYISDYRSDFGFVAGLNGPAQAYYFWRYWCDQHLIETEPKPNKERLQRFIKLMNAIYKADGRPFLAGFQAHAFYLEELVSIFDKCLFVFVKRDMLSAARSMLMGMRKNDGTFVEIFSATPKESLSEPGQTPYEKVARQAYFINRRINEMKLRFPDMILENDYYEICRHPQYFVEEFVKCLSDRGISFDRRRDVEIPVSFQARHATREQDEETNKIAVALDSLIVKYGPVD